MRHRKYCSPTSDVALKKAESELKLHLFCDIEPMSIGLNIPKIYFILSLLKASITLNIKAAPNDSLTFGDNKIGDYHLSEIGLRHYYRHCTVHVLLLNSIDVWNNLKSICYLIM